MKNKNIEYKVPKEFYKVLNRKFKFNFDPCSIKRKGIVGFESGINWKSHNFVCLLQRTDIQKWIIKTLNECSKGKLIVMLLPSRTDTISFHKYILRYAREIWFVRGRLSFHESGVAPFPSMIVIFRRYPRADNIPIKIRSVDTKLTGIRSHNKK